MRAELVESVPFDQLRAHSRFGASRLRAARASRFEPAVVVVPRRGKNASAPSSSVRRRAISDARSCLLSSRTTEQCITLRFSLNAAQRLALRPTTLHGRGNSLGSCGSCLGGQAPVIGGLGWTSSAGPSCSGPSRALSLRVARPTARRPARRVQPRLRVVARHPRPARRLPRPVSRQRRPGRIQVPAGRLAPSTSRGRPSSGGIRASGQLPGGRVCHA
jgi:hypothetical protein